MAKVKYYYDSDTLSYRKIELRKRDKFRRMIVFVVASAIMGGLFVFVTYQFVEPPKQKVMKRELENMKLHYELLEKKMDQAERVLDGIQKRDNNIYRTYFESNLQYIDAVRKLAQAHAKIDGLLLTGGLDKPSEFNVDDALRGQTFSGQ